MENRSSLQYISEFYAGAQKTSQPKTSTSKGVFARRNAKAAPKSGSTCMTCFEKKSVTGFCSCNSF